MNDALKRWRTSLLDGPRSYSGSQKSWLFSNDGDVVRRQVTALRRLALAERVVHVPGVAIREPLPERCLQSVVEHRLAAVHVIATRRAKRRVRSAHRSVCRRPAQTAAAAESHCHRFECTRPPRPSCGPGNAARLPSTGRCREPGCRCRIPRRRSSCPLRLADAMTAVSSVYIGHFTPFDATSVRLYTILNGINGFAVLFRTVATQVGAIQKADATAHDRRFRVVECPGKARSRTKVHGIRLIGLERIPQRTEIQLAADRLPARS